jgi:steroid delta-isomerase-like uncharacterized protein
MHHPIDLARDSVDAFTAGDWKRFRELHADGYCEEEFATGRTLNGIDAALEASQGWKRAFPDVRGEVKGAYADGPCAVLEIEWHGTNSGPMTMPDGGEMPATGRTATVRACQVFDTADGKITASRHYFDMMSLMSQLGAGAEMTSAVAD